MNRNSDSALKKSANFEQSAWGGGQRGNRSCLDMRTRFGNSRPSDRKDLTDEKGVMMKHRRNKGGLLVLLTAICLLAVGSPIQADPPGSEYDAFVFGAPVTTADGLAISMRGSISFKLRKGRTLPTDISGTGDYRIAVPGTCSDFGNLCFDNANCFSPAGNCDGAPTVFVEEGDWMATKLEGFHVEGRCGDFPDCFPNDQPDRANWTAGKGTFKIHMDGLGPARFIMWCRLPGIKLPQFSAFPESYRVDIGRLHFDGQDLAGNFFERTAE